MSNHDRLTKMYQETENSKKRKADIIAPTGKPDVTLNRAQLTEVIHKRMEDANKKQRVTPQVITSVGNGTNHTVVPSPSVPSSSSANGNGVSQPKQKSEAEVRYSSLLEEEKKLGKDEFLKKYLPEHAPTKGYISLVNSVVRSILKQRLDHVKEAMKKGELEKLTPIVESAKLYTVKIEETSNDFKLSPESEQLYGSIIVWKYSIMAGIARLKGPHAVIAPLIKMMRLTTTTNAVPRFSSSEIPAEFGLVITDNTNGKTEEFRCPGRYYYYVSSLEMMKEYLAGWVKKVMELYFKCVQHPRIGGNEVSVVKSVEKKPETLETLVKSITGAKNLMSGMWTEYRSYVAADPDELLKVSL